MAVLVTGKSPCHCINNKCVTRVVLQLMSLVYLKTRQAETVCLSVITLLEITSSSQMPAGSRTLIDCIPTFVTWQQAYDALRATPTGGGRALVGWYIVLMCDVSHMTPASVQLLDSQ